MDNINELPDELLVEILTFVPTKVAVSTSSLSKRWESLWKSVPKLDCDCHYSKPALLDFLNKNLPLRAPFTEILCLKIYLNSFQHEDLKLSIGVAVFRCLREVSINCSSMNISKQPDVFLPSSLYTSKSLVTLKLENDIFVDVPRDVCLPCLTTLHLQCVTYSNQDSLPLLLSHCPVLEVLLIKIGYNFDNVKSVVVSVPILQHLSLKITFSVTEEPFVIVTPSLKYFKFEDDIDDYDWYFSDLLRKCQSWKRQISMSAKISRRFSNQSHLLKDLHYD